MNLTQIKHQGIREFDNALYDPEYRYQFSAKTPAGPHVIFSGNVRSIVPGNNSLNGNEDDEWSNEFDVRLLVGPYWKHVRAVVPSITVNGFYNGNADEDDEQLWEVFDLTWDTVGELGPSHDELRIRLNCKVRVRGEVSFVIRLGYHVFASGRALGAGGLGQPGPVRQQG